MIVRASDRQYWNAKTGSYFLCGLAYSSTSATILGKENYYENTFSASNNLLNSFWLYEKDYLNFEFSNSKLKEDQSSISLSLGAYNNQNLGEGVELLY